MKRALAIILLLLCTGLSAQQPAATDSNVRFMAVDIFVDSPTKPLAAYQLEFAATTGDVKIVGIEGGEHSAFHEAPFYDPQAMQHERVILAAFSTEPANKLPFGKSRVATVHVQVSGTTEPQFELKLRVAADPQDNLVSATVGFEKRKTK